MSMIGSLEHKFILEGPVAYSMLDDVDEIYFTKKAENMLNKLNFFENHLWVMQNCCVGYEVGIISNETRITSVRHGGVYTLVSGGVEDFSCSAESFRILVKVVRDGGGIRNADFSKTYNVHDTKHVDRILLAIHLVDYAKLTSFIQNKLHFIVQYLRSCCQHLNLNSRIRLQSVYLR